MTAALATSDLSIRFGAFEAVRQVSLAIRPGARHALIGPNGAGKTTLVNALTGSLKPTAGRIMLAGEDATHLSEAQRVHKGLVRTFQINQLFVNLSVLDNVWLAVLERKRRTGIFWRSAKADRAALDEARSCLEFVHLLPLADQLVATLPYGSRRLLEIALAMAARPRVLVLDEPAAGVPAADSEAIFERIHALPDSLTLVFIENDMRLVFRFAERITVLVAGQILTEGTPADIAANPQVREVYLGRRGKHA